MAAKSGGVHVTGIPELNRALRDVNQAAYKELRKGFRQIARHVVGVAEGRGAPAGILRTSVTQRGAGVTYPGGGKAAARDSDGYYPWLDFGGGRATGRGVTAGGSRRGVLAQGRYVWPAIGESTGYIGDEAYEAIGTAARRVSLDTEGF